MIGYCHVVDVPLNDLTAVRDVLQLVAVMARKLPQRDVVVFDHAVFVKAQQKLLQRVATLSHEVAPMGGFDTRMMLLAITGKRHGDVGLRDILTEA